MDNTEQQEKDFQDILKAVMKTYHDKMHDYLDSKSVGTLTDADVVIMIMNLTMGIATNVYYSLKQILPTTPLDFEFMKAKISNSLIDTFEKIKEFNPKESVMPLTVEQIKEIQEKGSAIIKMSDGSERTITESDLLIKKQDSGKIVEAIKRETSKDHPTIIIPGNKKIIHKGKIT